MIFHLYFGILLEDGDLPGCIKWQIAQLARGPCEENPIDTLPLGKGEPNRVKIEEARYLQTFKIFQNQRICPFDPNVLTSMQDRTVCTTL